MKTILSALIIFILATSAAMGQDSNSTEQNLSGSVDLAAANETARNETGTNETAEIGNRSKSDATGPRSDYNAYVLIAAFLMLVLFASVPMIYNNMKAHQRLERTDRVLGEVLTSHKDVIDDNFLNITREYLGADPGGAPGTARGTMALSIVMLIGICLIMLLMLPDRPSDQLVKDVVLALTGALTTIIGFYFGGNGSKEPPKAPK